MDNLLAGGAGEGAAAHFLGETEHAVEFLQHVRRHVAAIDCKGHWVLMRGGAAQGHMQCRPVFRVIDALPGKEVRPRPVEPGFPGEIAEERERHVADAVLRDIERDIAKSNREILEPRWVAGKEIGDARVTEPRVMRKERLPRGQFSGVAHVTTSGFSRPEPRLMPMIASAQAARSASASCGSRSSVPVRGSNFSR